MAIWIQAAAFKLFGVSYKVYVMTAALLNAFGSGVAYLSDA